MMSVLLDPEARVDTDRPSAADDEILRPTWNPADSGPNAVLPEAVRDQVFIVLAAYNESGAIDAVVRELLETYPRVVVVDDGSADDTSEQARSAGAVVLRHLINRGQGAALQTGIEYSLRHGAEYIVTFDSDGQHRVEDIPTLISPILAGRFDIVLGSRFLGTTENMPASRRVLLKGAVLFTRLVSRVKLTDAHNGLRAFSRRAAEKINITLDRMAHASELIDQVRATGLPYTEVPVRIRYTEYSRAKGQSAGGAVRIVMHYLLGKVLS